MIALEDNYKHKGLRKNLVEILEKKGITDQKVCNVIGKIPRHLFMDSAFLNHAYEDKAFPIGEGQTISQPYTVAYQTQLLDIKKGEKILEIGTGSGYQYCVLVEMEANVYSMEYNAKLFSKTLNLLKKLKYPTKVFLGDGSKGMKTQAPFNKILVTAGAPFVPKALIEQLSPMGRLVIPVGNQSYQEMVVIDKQEGGKITKKSMGKFQFVDLKGDNGWKN